MGYWRTILNRSNGGALERSSQISISDPALAGFMRWGRKSTSGQTVTEGTALGLTALYRAVGLISGTLASLPWKTFRESQDGSRERVESWLDDPGAVVGLTPFAWRELLLTHLTLHGNAYGLHINNGAGQIVAMQLLHPRCVSVEQDPRSGAKFFRVSLADGTQRVLTPREITHFTSLSTDGISGISPLTAARNSIGSGLAADLAAAGQFESGLMAGGLVSSDEHLDETQRQQVKALFEGMGGAPGAGELIVTDASLRFSPWQAPNDQAQFLESRAFQVEEIARFYGIPKVLLASDGASTWGTGVAELVRGMGAFTFRPWAARIESALNRHLDGGHYIEIDFAGLLTPSDSEVVDNLVKEVDAGLLTPNEARTIRNREKLDGGDVPTRRTPSLTLNPPEAPTP